MTFPAPIETWKTVAALQFEKPVVKRYGLSGITAHPVLRERRAAVSTKGSSHGRKAFARLSDFNDRRVEEGWTRVAELNDFQAFSKLVNYSGNTDHKRFGPYVMAQVKTYPELEAEAGPGAPKRGTIAIFLDEGASQKFVSLSRKADDVVLVWSCRNPPIVTFRRTQGIVTKDGNPEREADVIMTAAALGLAASSYIAESQQSLTVRHGSPRGHKGSGENQAL